MQTNGGICFPPPSTMLLYKESMELHGRLGCRSNLKARELAAQRQCLVIVDDFYPDTAHSAKSATLFSAACHMGNLATG
jgi:hypothetical protein